MQTHAAACAVMLMLAAAAPAVADGGQRATLPAPAAAFVGQSMFRWGQLQAQRARLSTCARPRRAAPHTAVQANSKYEIDGTLIEIMDAMTFPSGFVKREFVLRTDEMYPQEVKFELVKDKTALIDSYQVNEHVKVSFNIRGSQWQGKYFTNLQAWKIQRLAAEEGQFAAQAETIDLSEWDGYGSKSQQQAKPAPKTAMPAKAAKAQVQWDDDIPF